MIQSLTSPFLLFEFPDCTQQVQRLAFSNPEQVFIAQTLEEVCPAIRAAQEASAAGFYVAGYAAYEAAPAFDSALSVSNQSKVSAETALPLVWFGTFRSPSEFVQSNYVEKKEPFHLSDWKPTITEAQYRDGVIAIREAIAAGHTYEVNHTFRLEAQFKGDDFAFYRQLCAAQGASYCAYLNLGRYRVLSASPELFFHRNGNMVLTRPMKGTCSRGRWPEEDNAQAAALASSEKDRAENVMIVDLLRNDLGRIAKMGTVQVPALWQIERYPTVFQMTSTVTAEISPSCTLEEIFTALFPSGSVTGAPKVSAMRFISKIEESPRQIYCGAIGLLLPSQEAIFNVAIRTVLLDTETDKAEYGVGGAITWDSTPDNEYAEAMTKAKILTEQNSNFELLETMRLENGCCALLERHLQRLADSAGYFDYRIDLDIIRNSLSELAQTKPTGAWRIRLLVSQDGTVRTESYPLNELPASPVPVALASSPISRHDRFLCHKTTNRQVYGRLRQEYAECYDVLLWNKERELTEFTTGNLVIELDNVLWTPHRDCGLLAGTLRAELLDNGKIQERVLTKDDLIKCSQAWLINSVREWVPVAFVDMEEG